LGVVCMNGVCMVCMSVCVCRVCVVCVCGRCVYGENCDLEKENDLFKVTTRISDSYDQ